MARLYSGLPSFAPPTESAWLESRSFRIGDARWPHLGADSAFASTTTDCGAKYRSLK